MFDIEKFIEDCKKAVLSDRPQQQVKALMEDAFSDLDALQQALDDASPGKSVAPLYSDENLTVLRVATPANFISPIHNHLMWAMIGILEGEEKNYLYRRTSNGGVEVEQDVVLTPETGIFTLRADAIHAIETSPGQELCGLHVYGGNILQRSSRSVWDPETMEERPYNFEQLMGFAKTLSAERAAAG
jgi:predicted metal-dependent enzyme (double-stranded beta helix superfamily)